MYVRKSEKTEPRPRVRPSLSWETSPLGLSPAGHLVPAHQHHPSASFTRQIFYGTAGVNQGTARLQQFSWRARPPGEARHSVIWEGGQRGGGHRQRRSSPSGVFDQDGLGRGGHPVWHTLLRHEHLQAQPARHTAAAVGEREGVAAGGRHALVPAAEHLQGGARPAGRRNLTAGSAVEGKARPRWWRRGGARLQRPATAVPPHGAGRRRR